MFIKKEKIFYILKWCVLWTRLWWTEQGLGRTIIRANGLRLGERTRYPLNMIFVLLVRPCIVRCLHYKCYRSVELHEFMTWQLTNFKSYITCRRMQWYLPCIIVLYLQEYDLLTSTFCMREALSMSLITQIEPKTLLDSNALWKKKSTKNYFYYGLKLLFLW